MKSSSHTYRSTLAISLASIMMTLTACGGGGGSDQPPAPTEEDTLEVLNAKAPIREYDDSVFSVEIDLFNPVHSYGNSTITIYVDADGDGNHDSEGDFSIYHESIKSCQPFGVGNSMKCDSDVDSGVKWLNTSFREINDSTKLTYSWGDVDEAGRIIFSVSGFLVGQTGRDLANGDISYRVEVVFRRTNYAEDGSWLGRLENSEYLEFESGDNFPDTGFTDVVGVFSLDPELDYDGHTDRADIKAVRVMNKVAAED